MEVSRKRAESPTSLKLGGKIPKLDTNMATEKIKNTVVDVGQQFDRWCELMVIIGAITHEAFALDLLNWFERCPKLSAARRKKGKHPAEKCEENDKSKNAGESNCDKSVGPLLASQDDSPADQRSEEPYKITLNDSCASSPMTPCLSPSTSQDAIASVKESTSVEHQSDETEKCEIDTSRSQGSFPVMVMALPGADESITADPSTTLQYTNQDAQDTSISRVASESNSNNVQQLEKNLYIPHLYKRNKFKHERKKLLCRKIFELVTCCGGEAFFQYCDEMDRTWTYATSDSMLEKYLTSGVSPGSSDSWMDHTGTVLNQITYMKKWQTQNKPNPLAHNSNGNALSYVDRKSSFSYMQGDVLSMPEKQVLLPPTISSSGAPEIVSSSSTSITLLLPSTALSSVHLTNAENILGKTSTSSTLAYIPAPAAASSQVKQTVSFPSSGNQSVMLVPQSHLQNTGVKTQTFAMPTAGHAILMPIQGNAKNQLSLLSPINKTILMPYSHLGKSTSLQPVSFPITYTDLSGLRKVTVSQTQEKAKPKKTVNLPKNSDTHLPVFSLLVSTSAGAAASSSKVLYTSASSATTTSSSSSSSVAASSSAAISKQPDKTHAEDIVEKPTESSGVSDSLVVSSSATVADQKKSTDVDDDLLVSSSVETPSTSCKMDSSVTSQVSCSKHSEKPVIAKSEIITTDKVFVEKSESFNKVSPNIASDDVAAQSKKDELDSVETSNSCKQKYEEDTSNDNNNESVDNELISSDKLHSVDVETTENKSDSEESENEMDEDDSSEENEDSFSSDEEAHCEVCGELYNIRRDNKRMGRWIGCEKDCGVWVHRKCVGWTEEMVDTQSYYCDKCQLERLCKLDESL